MAGSDERLWLAIIILTGISVFGGALAFWWLRRPPPKFWPLRVVRAGLKWTLVSLGAYMGFGLAYVELSEERVGLGLGLACAMISAAVGGVAGAFDRGRSSASRDDRI